jgi:hypothetical protein
MRRLATAVVVGLSLVVAQCEASFALSKNQDAGEGKCIAWCYAHNKTEHSQNQCIINCIDYYTPNKLMMNGDAAPAAPTPPRHGITVGHAPVLIGPASPGTAPRSRLGKPRLNLLPLP